MTVEKIRYTDYLKQGTDKLNQVVDLGNQIVVDAANANSKADTAISTADGAVTTANVANAKSDSTQTQLNTVVISGDSSVEAAQARVDSEGVAYTTLKERLDGEHTSVTSQLTEKASIEKVDKAISYASPNIKDFIYNFDIGLSKWFAKLAAFRSVSSKTINVSVPGDSITEGNAAGNQTPSQYFTNGYLGQLKSKFNTAFGNAGNGFIPVYLTTGSPMWTFTGFIQESGYFGATGISRMSQVNGDTATLSFNGTGIGIVFPKRSNGGILSVSIDGGAPITIDEYSATEIYADKFEITGLANAAHTMVITSVLTGVQKVWVHGAYEIASTTGVRFNMVGRSGVASGGVATTPALSAEIDVWSPTLTIIPLTANDYGGQVALSTYETNLQTLITRAKTFGDVLLVSIGLEITLVGETIPQIEYVKIQKKLADLNKVAFFDMYHLWGGNADFAKNELGYIYDHVHPTDLGHTDIANRLYEALTYNLNQSDLLVKEKTIVSQGALSGGVIGRGLQKQIFKAFGHRSETTAKDFIAFSHAIPSGSGESSTIIGTIKLSFAGRNTGGVRAYAAKIYDFYYDNNGNMTVTERLNFAPTSGGSTVAIVVGRKGTEAIIQITITPSSNTLTGSVFADVEYVQSYINDPIEVKFADAVV